MSQAKMTPLSDAGHVLRASAPVDLNVVFVHGFMGDALDTWSWRRNKGLMFWRSDATPVVLPELLAKHGKIPCHYYSVAHSAGIRSHTDIALAAGVLRTFLQTSVLRHATAPIVLVAHSFGGLACRQTILDMLEHDDMVPVVGLLMLGTPNAGTEIARLPEKLGSRSAADMRPFNDTLAEINREWARRVVNGGDPNLDAHRRMPMLCWAVVGTEDDVVAAGSVSSLASFADLHHLNKSHVQLPKARDADDLSFGLISGFLEKCVEFARARDHENAVRTLAYRLRQGSLQAGFVRRETVQIALRASELPHQYACRIVEHREGGKLEGRYTVCAWCPGQAPAIPIEFDWEIGYGTMDAATFDRMVQHNNAALDQYFNIACLKLRQHGQEGALIADGTDSGPGWHAWHFVPPPWFDPTCPYELLRLEVDTFTDDRQGWMFYSVPRTVLEHLDVSFSAPFRFAPLVRLGKGGTQRPVTPIGNGRFVSRAEATGPVAIGRIIAWIYDHADALTASMPTASPLHTSTLPGDTHSAAQAAVVNDGG